jgi:DNA polymerase II small subunit/DNA polymerase delta subunit B
MPVRNSIVGEFFKKGKLLTPEAIRYLENKDIEGFLADNYEIVVDIEDLMAREDRIRILKNITEKKSEVTTADIVKFYNSKYEKMRSIIASRLQKNFVSINKLDSFRNEIFIIGIVREIKNNENKKTIDVEDSTGSMTVVFEPQEAEDVELDDVVAIQGISAGKIVFGKKIMFPDMPLRQPVLGKGKACFISGVQLDEAPQKDFEAFLKWFESQDIRYLFVTGPIGDIACFETMIDNYCGNKRVFMAAEGDGMPVLPLKIASKNIVSLSNPSMVEVNGVKILLINNFDLKMLKKRHLGAIKPVLSEDLMTLEDMPDIVHTGSGEAGINNYKSTTIIKSGSFLENFKPVVVDFASRDCRQMGLEDLV